jgi:deoxyribonuclease IV
MLIGAHVSNAGGLDKAVGRALERECDALQIFNQSPRMWKPTAYTDDDFAAFREARKASRIDSVVIHAVYLLNTATEDAELTAKTLTSLKHSLTVGDAIGADGVVLHAGSALKGNVAEAIARAGKVIEEALADTGDCRLLLEDTAGTGGTLGRSFGELAALLDAAGGGKRLGVCLDSCHLLASGFDIRTAEGLSSVLDDFDSLIGLGRLGSLHLNDSQTPLGSNRDRHARVGQGELGDEGCAVFLSEPRFEDLPCVLETPGPDGSYAKELRKTRRLRTRGLKARA